MKKSLLSLVALVFGVSAFSGIASGLSISDIFDTGNNPKVNTAYTQLLNEYNTDWGYVDGASIKCNIEGNILSIVSPRVGDLIDDTAPDYRLFLSQYRLDQLKNGDPSVDTSYIKMMEQEIPDDASEVSFKLTTADINDNQIYYGFITPLDMYDVIGTPSKEVCFQLNKNICMLDTDCNNIDSIVNPVQPEVKQQPEASQQPEVNNQIGSDQQPEPEVLPESHGSAECISMEFANVRHSSDGKNITLTWTALPGSESVDIAIFNPTDEVFEKVGTAKMSDEKYVYPMRWNGVQNFILTNECGQSKYKADEGIKEGEPEKIVTPATGPAENIIYIAIAAIVLYGAYAIFFRKSDN